MFFTKYPHRANFSFATRSGSSGKVIAGTRAFASKIVEHEGQITHWSIENPELWGGNLCLAPLETPPALKDSPDLGIVIKDKNGKVILRSVPDSEFGVSGLAHMFQFELMDEAKFYGMGEKNFGQIELSGLRTKFWTTDVWSDFHFAQWLNHAADPPYFSLPYVAVHVGGEWVGFLLHNPYPTYMETPGTDESRVFVEWQRTSPYLSMGAEGGEPHLWIFHAQSLAELTRKFQKLVGVTPLPPAWALGYHQSRWEYGGDKDLMRLDESFTKHKIPCDGLWLDLDYMDEFRIFQTDRNQFPKGVSHTATNLMKNGRRIVPIIDPGVKSEMGYRVFDDGVAQDVFCKNVEGRDYIGMVWPGETVFPDFSLDRVRNWWSGYAKGFINEGYGAAWLDMNDPSTGPVDPSGMLFDNGKLPHEAHHNQYALGMQMATRQGFLEAKPKERPFLLSRSGFIGTSRYSAIWTGDNMSSYFYLKMCIPTSLGMSISGVPFNGPDVGGFGGDVTATLLLDWIKACCLFPFMRNHSVKDCQHQEPWAFGTPVMRIARKFIRLRYKMFPYLYNLFIDQEETGDAIMRPLLYEFDDKRFSNCSDQFMVGPSIMQAPILDDKERSRTVILPEGKWFDARNGEWISGKNTIVKPSRSESPLYIRNGAIIPMQVGEAKDNRKDLSRVEFHIFVAPGTSGETEYRYRFDDGLSFDYQSNGRSEMIVKVAWSPKMVHINAEQVNDGYGQVKAIYLVHGRDNMTLNGKPTVQRKATIALTGKRLTAVRVS